VHLTRRQSEEFVAKMNAPEDSDGEASDRPAMLYLPLYRVLCLCRVLLSV